MAEDKVQESQEERKPDIVVWDKDRGYYAKSLSYGSDLGAPAIKIDDVRGWRKREVANANHHIETKFNELRQEYERLMMEYELNQFVYSMVEYSFVPVVGYTYHLYKREDGSHFLSLIEPSQWKMGYVFSVQLDSNNKWIRRS